MNRLYKPLSLIVLFFLIFGTFFSSVPQSQAQTNPTGADRLSQTSSDDSNELPILVNVSGKVVAISATSVQIGQTVINIPTGMSVPSNISVGTTVTVRANLREDDTFILIIISLGYPTTTPVPTKTVVTPGATLSPTFPATVQPTKEATEEGTEEPAPTAVAGCDKQGQPLALFVSAAYNISYRRVITLHCDGVSFGEIARIYLVVISSEETDHPTTPEIVIALRRRGHHWSVIIIMLKIDVDPESIIIVIVNGGSRVVILRNCVILKHWMFCVAAGGSGGGSSGGGGGNGGMGDMGDD